MKKIVIAIITLLVLNLTLYAETAEKMEIFDTDGQHYNVEAKGDEIKIEGMEGKVVFLQFFGLRCPACKKEIPHLINLQNRFPNRLKVMAIEVQKSDNKPINAFKKAYGINYTTFSNFDIGYLVRYIIEKSGWKGAIPFMLVIDANGKVRVVQAGIIEEATLEEYVKKFSK